MGDIRWSTFNILKYKNVLKKMIEQKEKIYAAAYIMPSKIGSYGKKYKHENHLFLLNDIMLDNPIMKIRNMNKMEDLYKYSKSFPSIGRFLSYQYCIDINYSRLTNFDENEFVIAGPGAKRGIKKAFNNISNFNYEEIIKIVTQAQEDERKRYGYPNFYLRERKLQLIDIQNIFCEFDKFTRVNQENSIILNYENEKKKRIKQLFRPNLNKIDYVFPKKWGNVQVK